MQDTVLWQNVNILWDFTKSQRDMGMQSPCKHMHAHTLIHSYTPLLCTLREKHNFLFVLEASAPVSPHSRTARKSHFAI